MNSPIATIEVRIRDVRQLFNSLDATPFPDTDLDADAEEFILGWAMEFRSDAQLRLRIHIEQPPTDDEHIHQVKTALSGFFTYRADVVRRRLHRLMAVGRVSLIIGLACLAASVAGASLIGHLGDSALLVILRESLVIGGWVAMWRPLEILLYDWWPLRQERHVCERLARAEVEFVAASGSPSPTQGPQTRHRHPVDGG
jgi:hypothetical protein